MHVSGNEENFKFFIALFVKLFMKKYSQSVCLVVYYFAVNIPLFFYNCIPFRSRSRPVFYGSGSGSGSEQAVSAAPAPAPAPTKMCRLRRLRLRLRLRLHIPGFKISFCVCVGLCGVVLCVEVGNAIERGVAGRSVYISMKIY